MAKRKNPSGITEKELQAQFQKETGKKAIHCGKITKAYREWKKNH
ncbi:MAG: hypothetical protein ACFE8A_13210 [Candidatus Hodarchaeota archaeon]